jgi:hypothetical protein
MSNGRTAHHSRCGGGAREEEESDEVAAGETIDEPHDQGREEPAEPAGGTDDTGDGTAAADQPVARRGRTVGTNSVQVSSRASAAPSPVPLQHCCSHGQKRREAQRGKRFADRSERPASAGTFRMISTTARLNEDTRHRVLALLALNEFFPDARPIELAEVLDGTQPHSRRRRSSNSKDIRQKQSIGSRTSRGGSRFAVGVGRHDRTSTSSPTATFRPVGSFPCKAPAGGLVHPPTTQQEVTVSGNNEVPGRTVVQKVTMILDAFAGNRLALSLSDLARASGLPTSTVHSGAASPRTRRPP